MEFGYNVLTVWIGRRFTQFLSYMGPLVGTMKQSDQSSVNSLVQLALDQTFSRNETP